MLVGLKYIFSEENSDCSESEEGEDKADPLVINKLQSGPRLAICFFLRKNTCIFPYDFSGMGDWIY